MTTRRRSANSFDTLLRHYVYSELIRTERIPTVPGMAKEFGCSVRTVRAEPVIASPPAGCGASLRWANEGARPYVVQGPCI
jgi:hypothetical protein